MATKMLPWTVKLRELVSDGPVPLLQALAEMEVLVPPGRAFRDGQEQVKWQAKDAAAKNPDRHVKAKVVTDKEAAKSADIRRGARRLVYQVVWTQQRAGHVVMYDEGEVRMVRLGAKPWTG